MQWQSGQARRMGLTIAEKLVHHMDAAQAVADLIFLGHSDTTVDLDRAMYKATRMASHGQLGTVQVALGLRIGGTIGRDGSSDGHALGEFEADQHLGRPVPQRLILANQTAKLLTRVQVVHRQAKCDLHRPDHVGAGRRHADTQGAIDGGASPRVVCGVAQRHRRNTVQTKLRCR